MGNSMRVDSVPQAQNKDELRSLYLESLQLVERLHRRLLDVIKDEFERNGRSDINAIQALLLFNIGNSELTAGELRSRGYYLGSNVSYNLKKLVDLKTIVASDLGNKINDLLQEEWQREWESEPNLNNKLKRVLPKLNENHTPKGMTRRDGTVCARLRIGHSYLTHCYLLKGEPQPFCVSCNEALTINHLLTNCAEFADSRRKHYSTNTLEEVLSSGNYAHVLSFLKEINLYKKV